MGATNYFLMITTFHWPFHGYEEYALQLFFRSVGVLILAMLPVASGSILDTRTLPSLLGAILNFWSGLVVTPSVVGYWEISNPCFNVNSQTPRSEIFGPFEFLSLIINKIQNNVFSLSGGCLS